MSGTLFYSRADHGRVARMQRAESFLKGVACLLIASLVPGVALADCVSLTTLDAAYTQDFNTLATTGTSSTLPTGWSFVESLANANTTYAADTGSSTSGNTYSYGASGDSDRAFGTLQSGSLLSTIGACFTNNTGGTITSLDIAYTGEEWRLGTAGRADSLNFEYSTAASDVATGTWTGVAALNFSTPDMTTTGAKNGNAAADRTALSSTISGLSLASGATLWIHWIDGNASGSDDGLAVDDFSLTPHGFADGGPTPPTGSGSATPGSVHPGDTTLLKVAVTPGDNPESTGLTVTVDLSSIGGSPAQAFHDDGLDGDATAADNIFSYIATVDAATAAGIKSLPVTITDAQTRSGTTSISVTVALVPISIMTIQGHGTATTFVNQTVATTGVVTALKSNGFFIQDPFGDNDITTSDAVFVFTSTAPPANVVVGAGVTVTGVAKEFGGSTELTSPSISVDSTGNALPQPVALDAWPSDDPTNGPCAGPGGISTPPTLADGYQAANFACLDGMRVSISDATVTGATSGTGADGTHPGTPAGAYVTVTGHARPYRAPGAIYPGVAGHPEIPVWSGEPEIINVYFPGLTGFDASGFVLNAGSRLSVTGVIQSFKFAATDPFPFYEIYPSQANVISSVDKADNVKAVSDAAPGTLTIASQNMLHFFNDVNDSGTIDHCATQGSVDTCETTQQFNTRKQKLSLQIRTVLKAPAIVAAQEVENLATLQALADQIHDDDNTLTYSAYLIEGNDIGGIDVGFLVRSDVIVNAVTQIGKNTLTTGDACSAPCAPLNDRPPLLLDATFGDYHFAVLDIHNRSLSAIDDPTDGARVRAKRLQQAQYVGEIIQAWQTGSTAALSDGDHVPNPDATAPIIVVGDYNAYEFSDGYADVVGQIKGVVDPAQNLLSDTPHTSPTFCDAGLTTDPATRYSFAFDGYLQELDHALLSRIAWRDFVRLENAHGDADNSEAGAWVTDGTTPARSADHDGQVLTLATDRLFGDGFDGDTCH